MAPNTAPQNEPSGVMLAAMVHGGDRNGDKHISAIAGDLKAQGYRVGGVVQSNVTPADGCRCDMVLEELTTGQTIPISQNLGSHARGCRLDSAALEHVAGLVEASIRDGLDILVLNKFGKQEVEGGGLRTAIAIAVDAQIPILVGLNRSHVDDWNDFCGGEGQLLEADTPDLDHWLRSAL